MTDYMAETGGGSASPPPQWRVPPMITLPPRSSSDTFITGVSPGPMTFVSNFFSDHYPDTDLRSFSQLLDEVLPSPAAQNTPNSLHSSSSCQKVLKGDNQNRPTDLVITRSDSESNSSRFSSPLQDMVPRYSNSKPEPIVCLTNPASDGYKWRKYGQKQVKASELPRSYYKCTQVKCLVTKKVGHFLDGNISEIIYKGEHNHEPPLNRAKDGSAMDQYTNCVEEQTEARQWNCMVANEVAVHVTNRKKRKTEVGYVDRASLSRVTITEPKIVVQTRSEVDILDDGFKWRKYGQKMVKGKTYPRGYYRCTYAGCKVRKHVERASSDRKYVVTTYEGKHKHDIPVVAKPSNNVTIIKTERPILLQQKEEQIMT